MIRAKHTTLNVKNRPVWDKTDGRCWYCGARLLKPKPNSHTADQRRKWYTIDHALPRSRGGSDGMTNLLPSCNDCNADKCDMTVEEYRRHLIMRQHNVPYFSKVQLEYLESIDVDILAGLTHQFWGEVHGCRY